MTQYLSQKIKILSLISIIFVLYIHSSFHNYPHEIQGMAFNFKLQEFISGMLGRCAVPLFYAISGYLFFLNLDNSNKLLQKIKRRIKTLVIPFLIAALFFPFFYIVMENIPSISRFINSESFTDHIHQKTVGQILCSLFYDAGNGSPWGFHLWFLRDLIIMIACSPLLYYIKRTDIGRGILLLVVFLSNFYYIGNSLVYALFWFLAGDMFLIKLDKIKTRWPLIIFILISITELIYPNSIWRYFQIPIITLGIVGMWHLYNKLVSNSFTLKKYQPIYIACQFTFFIYLFHEPTLNIVRKLLILVIGHSSIGFAINYLISPWLFILLFTILGFYFKKYAPRIYNICVGSR